MTIGPEHLEHLQRTAGVAPYAGGGVTAAAPGMRWGLHVAGVGVRTKQEPPPADDEERWRMPSEPLVTGLYGRRLPFALGITSETASVRVELSTWSGREVEDGESRRRVLSSVLETLHPYVDAAPVTPKTRRWARAGVVLGVPSGARPLADGSLPLDRVLRALAGRRWAALVLARPVAEATAATLRHAVVDEIRRAQTSMRAEGARNPLVEAYVELLSGQLRELNVGAATGTWRTAVYLLADDDTYDALAGVWAATFSGRRSIPEPVRVVDAGWAADLAAAWAMPDQEAAAGPARGLRPYEFQTVLTSGQLAAYAHLPALEVPGFSIQLSPRFDTVTASTGTGIAVGTVLPSPAAQPDPEGAVYRIAKRDLTRHVFVCGVTGSGKTNTVLSLLTQVAAEGVPFLVLEPAKAEYRALPSRVFTVGDENVAPLRLNPFEVPPGTPVAKHVDLLKSVFAASFAMWSPLPQILERALHETYAEYGWDTARSTNRRVGPGGSPGAFPTLTDLADTVDRVIDTLGYEGEVVSNIRAALATRLRALRVGGKGRMLDTRESTPSSELFDQPVVVELERLGDDEDKAFVMGLLLVRLAEHRWHAGTSKDLRHLLVVEEAHRVLSNVSRPTEGEQGGAAFTAVQTFVHLLAEVRAYGQGVVIADQVPVRLAPEAIKNTNLKITHRLVAADDRKAVAETMGMNEDESRGLTVLRRGHAAVFSEGDDYPVLLLPPLVTDGLVRPPDAEIAAPPPPGGVLPEPAASVAASPVFVAAARRVLQAALESPGAFARGWDDLVAAAGPEIRWSDEDPDRVVRAALAEVSARWVSRRGQQAGWAFDRCDELAAAVLAAADAHLGQRDPGAGDALVALAAELHTRTTSPFPGCSAACPDGTCLYRYAAADLVRTGRFDADWELAEHAPDGEAYARMWQVATAAANHVTESTDTAPPEDAPAVAASAARAAACVAQHLIAASPSLTIPMRRTATEELFAAVGFDDLTDPGGPE